MIIRRLLQNEQGGSAAEFALVLPFLLLMIFGTFDVGRYAWEINRAEKATQVGARVAVVTSSFPPGIVNETFVDQTVGGTKLTQGDVIPAGALGDVKCTRSACSCVAGPCPTTIGTIDTTVFDSLLLPRMQAMKADITAANIEIHYTGSGLGFAGDPNGMELAPIVTVKLTGMNFTPVTGFLLKTIQLPDFRTSLTAEDASGSRSN